VPFAVRARRALAVAAEPPSVLSPAELSRFSLADLFYRDEQLDDALDLMALCRKPI